MRRLFLLWAACLGCELRPQLAGREVDLSELGKRLRPGFLLGAATSSHQVEGNNSNDWTDWEETSFEDGRPHIEDGSRSGLATDSYSRFEEDLQLLRRLGANAYRFSIEWSRLQPEENLWREEVANRYLQWAIELRQAGIEPMVTVHHFTLPKWVAARGGWESDGTLEHFERFASRLAGRLGSEVDLWCTVNEPNVQAVQGYLLGIWPPGKQSNRDTALVMARLIEAHARAAKAIRAADRQDADHDGKPAMVGLAHHARIFQPATGSALDASVAALTDDFFNETVVRAARTGRIQLSVPGQLDLDKEVPGLLGSFDYLGLNYYTRDHVRADLSDPSFSHQYVPEGRPRNGLGWDIYPEGLYLLLRRFAREGLPIYVTENGIADNGGEQRPTYLAEHLFALERAASEGVDVRGYFHWSLLDNFEWAEGYEPRFGLFRVDFDGPERTRTETQAVDTFRQVARNLGLSPAP
ncbi:MAG: family 1 glycosylhydrolase [Myxococcales bacterium]|nr:family 1 glycosylhydrolase [Myxococcales bacterium]